MYLSEDKNIIDRYIYAEEAENEKIKKYYKIII